MNKILLTGAEGTIGSSLFKYLTNREYKVTQFIGDIRDEKAWDVYKTGMWDALIHLAAIPGVRRSFDDPELYYDVNVNGTLNALEFSKYWVDKTVYASSSNAYEWWENPYAATKKMCEVAAEPYKAIGVRFHTVWPGRPDMLFQKLLAKQVTHINANHYRDWIHIDDVCSALLTIIENYHIINERVLDIGTGKSVSVRDVAKLMGFEGVYNYSNPPGERIHTQANIERLLALKWSPKRNILDEASNFK